MKLLYVSFVRLPTEKAHGVQIMKTCEALANQGSSVELIVPDRRTSIQEDVFNYYGIERNFQIKKLIAPDLTKAGPIGFLISILVFSIRTAFYIFNKKEKNLLIYTRDAHVGAIFSFFNFKFLYEVHKGEKSIFTKRSVTHADSVIANSVGTKEFFENNFNLKNPITVIPNGVDLEAFKVAPSKVIARERLMLPSDKKIVMYTGHLYNWKGAHILAEAAAILPKDYLVVFVGGTQDDLIMFQQKYGALESILIAGHKPSRDIPLYIKAADVVVLPNVRIGESEQFTSPIKLFEYMASGVPIVASDLPSVRHILDTNMAAFVTPGDPQALADRIMQVVSSPEMAESLAIAGRERSKQYSWDNRASLILGLIDALVRKQGL